MRTRHHIAVLLVGAVLVLAGCAQGGAVSSTPASSGVASPTPSPAAPPSSSASVANVVLTGVIEAGVEPRCLILRQGTDTFQLIGGDPAIVKAGARVQVTGHLAVGVMSYCMQGKPFQVTSAQAL